MALPRVSEIAAEFGLPVAVVMTKLRQLGEFAGGTSSTIQPPVARRLRAALEADGRQRSAVQHVQPRTRMMSAAQMKISNSGAIDAGVELGRELDRLSDTSVIAARAPRGAGLTGYLARGMATEPLEGTPGEFTALTESLLQRLSIWWAPSGYARLPTMVPWCIRDRSARYDQGPESWSAPRDDGYLRDDNSIIKKLPLPVRVRANAEHPYADRKPWRGFTACHIWRELPDGKIAGTDPWLYSFMPNLVWIPSPLSALSDIHESHVQLILQRTSFSLFRAVECAPSVRKYSEYAWGRLPHPPTTGRTLDVSELALFEVDAAFVARRMAYLNSFISGADEVLQTGRLSRKLISTRYTQGLPLLDPAAIANFRDALASYRNAVADAE